MSFVTRLIGLLAAPSGPGEKGAEEVDDDRLAVAALLVHVARVDGGIGRSERRTLVRLLHERFGLAGSVAERLVARADALDREVDDVATLIEMMGHSIDDADRTRLLAMAFEVAAADGTVQEFEDDLLWRVGQLLGFTDADLERIRSEALRPAAAEA